MKRLAAALVAGCAGLGSLAADEDRLATGIDLRLSRDTEGFEAHRVRVLGLTSYENPWKYYGVELQSARYRQEGYRESGEGVLVTFRDQRRDTLAGVVGDIGLTRVAGHLRPVGEVTLRLATSLQAPSYELVAAADLVETRRALERGIAYGLGGASVEVPLSPRFTATAFVAGQGFSDGNARAHLRARLIWLASETHGVTLQARYRGYRSRDEDVGGAYFNPESYQQWLAVMALRKRVDGWTYAAEAGAGREYFAGTSRPAHVAELRAEGPLAGDIRLILRAGYSRSAGYSGDPGYAWRYLGATVVVPLDP